MQPESSPALRDLLERYRARTPASAAFTERLSASMPGGETRAVTFYEPHPVIVAAADGARVTDLDDNNYVDLVCNMAALVHGHRFPPVMEAIARATDRLGTPAREGFLEAVLDTTHRAGALLVLDEVQSMRNHLHAEHGRRGLRPDLVLLGKAVAGGLPIGVLGGRAELMEQLSGRRHDGVEHSGTFNGNVVTTAAGYVSMTELTAERIGELNARAEWLASSLERLAAGAGVVVNLTRSGGSIVSAHFQEHPPHDAAPRAPHPAARFWHLAALVEGVYVPRGGRFYLSTALDGGDLEEALTGLAAALRTMRALTDEL